MPELPEVEAARRAVEEHCVGKRIRRSVVAVDSKVIDGVSSADFQSSLIGKTIISALRKGKNMWLQLDSPPFPSFQFGMAGAIYIKGVAVTKYKRSAVNDTDEWPSKYSKFFIELEDGLELSFTDKRRFAKVRLLADPSSQPPISELGPDALLQPMTEEEFFSSLSKKKIAIKPLILDQSYISGIGNWIADEVLYQAKIHPLQSAMSLPKESCIALHKCIKEVIEKAIEVGADSSQFPSNWIFHSREKKPGKAFVDGKKIEFINAGGRTTAYVPELQKLTGAQAAKAPAKSSKQDTGDDDGGAGKPGDEEEESMRRVQSQNGQNATRGVRKKPFAKRKSKDNDDYDYKDDDNNDSDDQKKMMGGMKNETKGKGKKKAPAKRKSKDWDDDDGDSDNSEDKMMTRGRAKTKQTEVKKTSSKNMETSKKVKQSQLRKKVTFV